MKCCLMCRFCCPCILSLVLSCFWVSVLDSFVRGNRFLFFPYSSGAESKLLHAIAVVCVRLVWVACAITEQTHCSKCCSYLYTSSAAPSKTTTSVKLENRASYASTHGRREMKKKRKRNLTERAERARALVRPATLSYCLCCPCRAPGVQTAARG